MCANRRTERALENALPLTSTNSARSALLRQVQSELRIERVIGLRDTDGIHVLLLHSPLVGPSTMKPMVSALEAFGWEAFVIDNRDGLESPTMFLEHAARQTRWKNAVLIGHSGAGAFLPALAAKCDALASVFVDAVLPPREGAFRPSASFIAFLDTVTTHDGLLARWDKWWPAGVVENLVPQRVMRDAITAEFPRVSRRFYDHDVEVPAGWSERSCCYLGLSPAYDQECERAMTWRWPVQRLNGQHLDIAANSAVVADAVVALISELKLPAF
jgi:hypothetical protein